MGVDKRARKILSKAEEQLAALASELVAARQYDEARPVLQLADDLRGLGRDRTAIEPAAPPPPRRSPAGRAGYPRFAVEDDSLVKIGWSRQAKAEYEHRSPLSTLQIIARAVSTIADRRGRFTTEDLMPLSDADGREVPSYQSYLCLAFLRHAGLVGRGGRSKYAVLHGGDLPAAAVAALESHAPRRA